MVMLQNFLLPIYGHYMTGRGFTLVQSLPPGDEEQTASFDVRVFDGDVLANIVKPVFLHGLLDHGLVEDAV